MKQLFAIFGILFLAVFALAVWMDQDREWKKYQRTFFDMQAKLAKSEAEAKAIRGQSPEVKRIWLAELDRVDRCIICHLGVEDPRFKDAPQPFKTHPDIAPHTFEKLGCTLCHQGQGRATVVKAAHGDVEFWTEPLLRGVYLQVGCANCHDPLQLTAAPVLNQGAQLFDQLGCRGCHKIAGRGGDIGPDLTRAGRFSIEYLTESIVNPKANDPKSIMPDLKLPKDKVEALVVFLMAQKGRRRPVIGPEPLK